MSGSARVDSIDAIREFRVYLTKFRETASDALGDADSDLNRMQAWLEGEQTTLWNGQLRKRQEAVVKAEDALRQKKLFKDSTGGTASAVDEQKALSIAKKNLAEAQQKVVAIKQWIRRLQKEVVLYKGGVARFTGTVSGMIPAAIGQLGGTIEMLEKYVGLGPAPSVGGAEEGAGAGAGRGEGKASMARAEGEEAPAEEDLIDPESLRKQGPKEEEIGAASKLEGRVELGCGAVSARDQSVISALLLGEPDADMEEAIVIARPAASEARLWLVREGKESKAPWRMGVVDGDTSNGYNRVTTSQLIADRADLAELMRMPQGWLAVVGKRGLIAIFNQRNEKIFPLAAGKDKPDEEKPAESAEEQTQKQK